MRNPKKRRREYKKYTAFDYTKLSPSKQVS